MSMTEAETLKVRIASRVVSGLTPRIDLDYVRASVEIAEDSGSTPGHPQLRTLHEAFTEALKHGLCVACGYDDAGVPWCRIRESD